MKTRILKLTALLVLSLFAGINFANAQSTPPAGTPVIAMTVTNNATIKMSFYLETAGTVWIETAPGAFTPENLSGGWNHDKTYTAAGTTLKVHGNLTGFNCNGNGTKLTGLDPSGNILLTNLNCGHNSLTALNVSALTELTTLYCYKNNIASLDVSHNTKLTQLQCNNNSNLQTLNLTANTELDYLVCSDCALTGLDISANTKLTYLVCYNNPFTAGAGLDVSNNTLLKTLACNNLGLTSLNVAPLAKLKTLYINGNNLDACALDKIYSCLPAVTSGNLYNDGNPGTATSKTSIATAKGWTNGITAGDGTGCAAVYATVTTSDVSAFTHNSAALGGVAVPGTETVAAKGIEWKKTAGGTFAELPYTGTDNTFTVNLTGLEGSTGYTFRAYIKVGAEKRYGAEKTFITNETPIPTTVATNAATDISQTSAKLHATITPGTDVVTERGFEWKLTTGGTYAELVDTGTDNTYTADLTGLTANTNYTFRAYIKTGGEKRYGDEMTFNTAMVPTPAAVTTNAATDITKNSATLGGVVAPGTDVISERGFEWKKSSGGTYTDLVYTGVNNTYTASLTGLTSGTSYTFRAYAKVGNNKVYGAEKTFTTAGVAATVTTSDATAITQTTATLNGVVNPGTDVIGEKGFEWKLTTGGTYADLISTSTTNAFTANLTGLTANTSYTFRVYVKVGAEKRYGAEKTFTTAGIPAVVTTSYASDVTPTTAVLNGTVNPGTDIIGEKGFEWKKTIGGTYADLVSTSTTNAFTANLTGLTANTSYTFRAYVKVGAEKRYGAEKTFTTAVPTVNMKRWMELTVTPDNLIDLSFIAYTENTFVKIVSGTNDTTLHVNSNWKTVQFNAQTSTIKVYGDVDGFNCSNNRTKLTGLDISHNAALVSLYCEFNSLASLDITSNAALVFLYCAGNSLTSLNVKNNTDLRMLDCHDNNFSTQAIDNIYCDLPQREADDNAKIFPVRHSSSSNHATVMATNKQNAIAKKWDVLYYANNAEIPATGTYVCGTGIELVESSVSIYPNPAKDFIIIATDAVDTAITITDLSGRTVMTADATDSQTTLNISRLNAGTYIIRAGYKMAKVVVSKE